MEGADQEVEAVRFRRQGHERRRPERPDHRVTPVPNGVAQQEEHGQAAENVDPGLHEQVDQGVFDRRGDQRDQHPHMVRVPEEGGPVVEADQDGDERDRRGGSGGADRGRSRRRRRRRAGGTARAAVRRPSGPRVASTSLTVLGGASRPGSRARRRRKPGPAWRRHYIGAAFPVKGNEGPAPRLRRRPRSGPAPCSKSSAQASSTAASGGSGGFA